MRAIATLAAYAAIALTCGAAGPAPADIAPWAKPFAGRWTLSGVSEGDPVCGLALSAAQAIGGAQIEVSATCRRNYPFEDVAGWRLDGRRIVLIDALRHPLFTFTPEADGSFGAALPGGRGVSLERGAPERPKSVRALFDDEGTFTLSGPDNKDACGFGVSASTATSGKLEQAGRCPAPWKAKGWASWSVAGDVLSLKDRKGGVILTMKRADEYTFTADRPDDPLFFGPGVIDGSEMLQR